jgi:hypothetical protein
LNISAKLEQELEAHLVQATEANTNPPSFSPMIYEAKVMMTDPYSRFFNQIKHENINDDEAWVRYKKTAICVFFFFLLGFLMLYLAKIPRWGVFLVCFPFAASAGSLFISARYRSCAGKCMKGLTMKRFEKGFEEFKVLDPVILKSQRRFSITLQALAMLGGAAVSIALASLPPYPPTW